MSLEEQFYKEIMPEGKNNYVLSGQAKILLMLCKAIDELKATEQDVQLTGLCPDCKNPLAWEVVSKICPNHQYRPATNT